MCKPKTSTRLTNKHKLNNWPCRTTKFSLSFFPSSIKYWNALEEETKCAKKLNAFKTLLLKKIRPKRKEYFGILDKEGTRFITLLRMGLSPLRKHKFDHNFNDTPFPICPAHDGVENTKHFLLLCKSFSNFRTALYWNVTQITNVNFEGYPDKKKIEILLYGAVWLTDEENKNILMESIHFIRTSKRFENCTP